MNRRIRDVLADKGNTVYSVTPFATVTDAVNIMVKHRIGAVMVLEKDYPIGIFTERDVLVRIVMEGVDPRHTLVRDVMTTELHTATLDSVLIEILQLMTLQRCRHIPVLDGDRLVGLISIGDLTKAIQHGLNQEVRELSKYIGGPYLS